MKKVDKVLLVNRLGVILHKTLFPEEDPLEDTTNPMSKVTVICSMLNAAYDIGYADAMRDRKGDEVDEGTDI